ncbi:MAG: hypothetical protein FJ267_12640 [Planctomycetes bacterium]|nr:hypothetical protein [Planctomycetota bacterium]
MLRKCLHRFLQNPRIAPSTTNRLTIEPASSTDCRPAIGFRLIHLAAPNRQTMQQTHAEPDHIPNLKRLATTRFRQLNIVVGAISTVTTLKISDLDIDVMRYLQSVCFVMVYYKLA